MEKGDKICLICSKHATKYRCPKCDVKYCSLGCFKTHKESCQVNSVSAKELTPPAAREDTSSSKEDPSLSLKILSSSQKEKLRNSKNLQEVLRSKRLRDHITEVDSAPDRQNALKCLRSKNQEFESFLQDILVVVKEG